MQSLELEKKHLPLFKKKYKRKTHDCINSSIYLQLMIRFFILCVLFYNHLFINCIPDLIIFQIQMNNTPRFKENVTVEVFNSVQQISSSGAHFPRQKNCSVDYLTYIKILNGGYILWFIVLDLTK